MLIMKTRLKTLFFRLYKFLKRLISFNKNKNEINLLYRILYDQVHDLNESMEIVLKKNTQETFAKQWKQYKDGYYLLSDPWFKKNLTRIICEEEILIKPEWFKGKEILDAGCGNGRWTHGLCKLEAKVTSVDINIEAIEEAKRGTEELHNKPQFVNTSLENIKEKVNGSFDLVFSWGVLHHCKSFNQSLNNLASLVKEGGIIYLYLYGRETNSMEEDLDLFKKRVHYNLMLDEEEQYRFLYEEANGDITRIHNLHDNYAPLVNRRHEFEDIKERLYELGFNSVLRTIDHSELFIRAFKGDFKDTNYLLNPKKPPYWFQHHKY